MPTSFATCRCQHCDNGIEFEIAHAGETIACPHCQMETMLFIPPTSSHPQLEKPPKITPPAILPTITAATRQPQIQKPTGIISRERVKVLLSLGIAGVVVFVLATIPDFPPSAAENECQKQLNDCATRIAEPNRIMTNALAESERFTSQHDLDKAIYFTGIAISASTNITEIYLEFKPIKDRQMALKNARQAGIILKLFLACGCAVFTLPWLLYLFLVVEKKRYAGSL